MRVTWTLLALIFFLSAPLNAQEKSPEKKTSQETESTAAPSCSPDKIVAVAEVAKQMAESWCAKLHECAPDTTMEANECQKILKKSFQQGFKNVPAGQKVDVNEADLCHCTESIAKDTCSALRTAQTLPGCGFIRLLNRG